MKKGIKLCEMKKHLRKLVLSILCIGLIFCFDHAVFAALNDSHTLSGDFSFNTHGWHANWGNQKGLVEMMWIDGNIAWCVQPTFISYTEGTNNNQEVSWKSITSNPAFPDGISDEAAKLMGYVAYVGYKSKQAPTQDDYVLTQNLIYRILGYPQRIYINDVYPDWQSQKAWQDDVLAKAESLMKDVPLFSLDGQTNVNDQLILHPGESITLIDKEGILEDFNITDDDGLILSKNGNQLGVTVPKNWNSSKKKAAITFNRDFNGQNVLGSSFAVRNHEYADGKGSQAVSSLFIQDTVQTSFSINIESYGHLKLIKMDDEGHYVPNTSFDLSYDSDMNHVIATYTTGADGSVTIHDLLPQNIYIQETSVPVGLELDSSIHSITLQQDQTLTYTQVNKVGKGSLRVTKNDELTGSLPQGEASLQGAIYELKVKEDIIHPSTGEVILKAGTLIGSKTTSQDGTMPAWENLYAGKYELYETKEPLGYQKDPTHYEININTLHEKTVEQYFDVKEKVICSDIKVFKKDSNSDKIITSQSTEFELLNWDKEVIQSAFTENKGYVLFEDLPYGHYYVREKKAPYLYVLNSDTLEFFIDSNGVTLEGSLSDQPVKGSISLQKQFDETETGRVGDASLEGVTYELHAHHDILDPADGSLIFSENSVIPDSMKKTDENGKIVWENLYLGTYDIHEVSSNQSVTINTIDVKADLQYKDQHTPNVNVSVIHKDKPNEQAYSLIKIGSDGSIGETPTLEGAEFTAKLKSDVDLHGWDQAFTYDISVTDSKGYLVSGLLPYGTYIVKETKKPNEHIAVNDFIITITEECHEPQTWRIMNDAPFEGRLKLIKKDKETGKIVQLENTTFKIKNLDTNEYVSQFVWFPLPHRVDTWTTTDQGIVYLNNVIMHGNYQLEEIKAPQGYHLNSEPVTFNISENGIYETGEDGMTPVISVVMEDVSIKGQICIHKEGETFSGIHQNADGNISFDYEWEKQDDTEFNILANEDIMDPSNDKTLLFKKDEIVEKVITDQYGLACSSLLPLGEYRIEEVKVKDGMVLNTESKIVSLSDENQKEDVSFKNEIQNVAISIIKTDENHIPLKDAIYGLYTKTDLMIDHKVLLPADTLIETVQTNELGQASFNAELPVSLDDEIYFYVKEIQQPKGYLLSDELFDVNTKFSDPLTASIMNTFHDINFITKTEFSKIDLTTGKELPGAHIFIKDKESDEIVDDYVSTDQPHLIEGLEVNKTYLMIEESAPYGFHISETIEFTIQPVKQIQKVEMKDDLILGKLAWSKTGSVFSHTKEEITEMGIITTPVFENKNLCGAEISIYANEDITLGNGITYFKKDEWIQTLTSDHKAVESDYLPVGKYYYLETKAPYGYVLDTEKHPFEIKNDPSQELQIIKSPLENQLFDYQLDVTKTMEQGFIDDAYKDVVFGIYTKEAVYDYLNEQKILPDTLVALLHIDENGAFVENPRLPIGHYYVKELKTHPAYMLDENKYEFSIDPESERIIMINDGNSIENKLKKRRVHIYKIDSNTYQTILDNEFEFSLFSDPDCTDKITSMKSKNGFVSFTLPYGIFYIQETIAPENYLLSDQILKIEINEKGLYVDDILMEDDCNEIKFENEMIPSTSINTSDSSVDSYLTLCLFSFLGMILLRKKHSTSR